MDLAIQQTKYYSLAKSYPAMDGFFINDAELGYTGKPNHPETFMEFSEGNYILSTDSLGNFSSELDISKDYLICSGDSAVWGHGKKGLKFCDQLTLLTGIQNVNTALPGYGMRQWSERALKTQKVLNKIPKLVVFGVFLGNDIEDDKLFPGYTIVNEKWLRSQFLTNFEKGKTYSATNSELNKIAYPPKNLGEGFEVVYRTVRNWFLKNSVFFNLFERAIYSSKKESSSITARPQLGPYLYPIGTFEWFDKQTAESLSRLIDISREFKSMGSEVVIILIPSKESIYIKDYFPNTNQEILARRFDYSNYVQSVLLNEGFKTINPINEFLGPKDYRENISILEDPNSIYWVNDNHWNHEGQALGAELVYQAFLK